MNVRPRVRHAFHACAPADVLDRGGRTSFSRIVGNSIYHTADSR